eukprot:CAMPEP_0195011332 /NCGR_PEP_ID=MMETSP0326_2-20130528/10872_1 /TAXON_ID=2866 ORGANISM="Crypthecodinium cohnii, Strain Seligo" /NCGR_SAMPLE_ID=MMETSP0326_2 /ASSEMBLY_ACC=CAM_ASM_000348 /LENGTH=59 /DNA_ID=CAMNT_0040020413 /DNA_START=55 /DNA_END=234 /DNA_ORIENTATION=-
MTSRRDAARQQLASITWSGHQFAMGLIGERGTDVDAFTVLDVCDCMERRQLGTSLNESV